MFPYIILSDESCILVYCLHDSSVGSVHDGRFGQLYFQLIFYSKVINYRTEFALLTKKVRCFLKYWLSVLELCLDYRLEKWLKFVEISIKGTKQFFLMKICCSIYAVPPILLFFLHYCNQFVLRNPTITFHNNLVCLLDKKGLENVYSLVKVSRVHFRLI